MFYILINNFIWELDGIWNLAYTIDFDMLYKDYGHKHYTDIGEGRWEVRQFTLYVNQKSRYSLACALQSFGS